MAAAGATYTSGLHRDTVLTARPGPKILGVLNYINSVLFICTKIHLVLIEYMIFILSDNAVVIMSLVFLDIFHVFVLVVICVFILAFSYILTDSS